MDQHATDGSDGKRQLLECFRAVFPFLTDDEIKRADKADIDEWDSLASLSLITVIEEEFDVRLSEDAIIQLDTFDRALAAAQMHENTR